MDLLRQARINGNLFFLELCNDLAQSNAWRLLQQILASNVKDLPVKNGLQDSPAENNGASIATSLKCFFKLLQVCNQLLLDFVGQLFGNGDHLVISHDILHICNHLCNVFDTCIQLADAVIMEMGLQIVNFLQDISNDNSFNKVC